MGRGKRDIREFCHITDGPQTPEEAAELDEFKEMQEELYQHYLDDLWWAQQEIEEEQQREGDE